MLSFTKKVLTLLDEKLPPPNGAHHAFIRYMDGCLTLSVALLIDGAVRFQPVIFENDELDKYKAPEEVIDEVLEGLKGMGLLK